MEWKNRLVGKPALVSAAVGAVLTFLVTVGKMVEPRVLVLRYAVNMAVFYLLGVLVPWAWERFVATVAAEGTAPAGPEAPSVLPGTEPMVEEVSAAVGAETAPAAAEGEGTSNEASPAPAAKKGSHTDFEIRDEYIVIKDRKIPNDPKLMAQAIKTKISE